LPLLFVDLASVAATTATTRANDAYLPASGAPAYYQVYGRKSCSGVSVGP